MTTEVRELKRGASATTKSKRFRICSACFFFISSPHSLSQPAVPDIINHPDKFSTGER
jgi:hypothetical protein